MNIKEDIVKYKKEVFINKSGIDTLILKQKDKT